MKPLWWKQIRAVIRLEMKKTFFAKRGLWIYLLALAPVALFVAHSLVEIHVHGARQQMALQTARPLTEQDFSAIQPGMTREEVIARLGKPPSSSSHTRRVRTGRRAFDRIPIESFRYSDGNDELFIMFEKGLVVGTGRNSGTSLGQDSYIFAGVFQFFFVRLAIFFGCLGIFMNLFRGEMLDKSLHFYLLAPVRREILLVGKYLAGLLAACVIFTASTAMQIAAMLLRFDSATISHYLYENHGISQIAAYLGVSVLACIGYGGIFLAAGLLFRNPILPAVAVLIWEAANPVLPALLKKFSVIYYLKSLLPVNIPLDPGLPPLMALLVSTGDPVSGYVAVFGLLALSIAVLLASTRGVHRLEINYTSD
jgi:ABC-type transport system involved in multi-copper enzyme maturation permease subunit